MTHTSRMVARAVALALCASGAYAAEQPLKASQLIGESVKDSQGEEVGKIEDIAVDLQSGEVSYIVLSTGGARDAKLVAVTPETLRQAPRGEGLISQVSRQELENARGFSEEQWRSGTTSQTEGQGGGQSIRFSELDEDRDGFVTEQEAETEPQLAQQFDQVDRDGDGQLDTREFAQFQEQQVQGGGQGQRFSQLDEDRDGFVSEQEAETAPQLARQFDQVDQDADGQVDATEFSRFQQQQRNGTMRFSQVDEQSETERQFEQIDRNGDGQIDQGEFSDYRERL